MCDRCLCISDTAYCRSICTVPLKFRSLLCGCVDLRKCYCNAIPCAGLWSLHWTRVSRLSFAALHWYTLGSRVRICLCVLVFKLLHISPQNCNFSRQLTYRETTQVDLPSLMSQKEVIAQLYHSSCVSKHDLLLHQFLGFKLEIDYWKVRWHDLQSWLL